MFPYHYDKETSTGYFGKISLGKFPEEPTLASLVLANLKRVMVKWTRSSADYAYQIDNGAVYFNSCKLGQMNVSESFQSYMENDHRWFTQILAFHYMQIR